MFKSNVIYLYNQNVDFNECNPGQRISFSDGPRRFNGQISSATFLLSLEKKSKSRSYTSRNVDEDVKFIFGRLNWGRLGIMSSIYGYIVYMGWVLRIPLPLYIYIYREREVTLQLEFFLFFSFYFYFLSFWSFLEFWLEKFVNCWRWQVIQSRGNH